MSKVIVIGAGISGIMAARELNASGHQVILLDKGRGVGGRMATRRFDGGVFDHGAQFFTATSPEFLASLQSLLDTGQLEPWFVGAPGKAAEGDLRPRYRGTPGMTAVPKKLVEGLDLRLSTEVELVSRDATTWTVQLVSGEKLESEWLVMTSPAEQSLNLLSKGGVTLPASLKQQLECIGYEPCFAVLATLEGPSGVPEPGAVHPDSAEIYWISDNFRKGISPETHCITLHSTGAWAACHYHDDSDAVARELLALAAPIVGQATRRFEVRRWRYAKAVQVLDVECVLEPELQLVLAGDGFLGARVEAAALSGLAAARTIGAQEASIHQF